jgi:hypothetical protein
MNLKAKAFFVENAFKEGSGDEAEAEESKMNLTVGQTTTPN